MGGGADAVVAEEEEEEEEKKEDTRLDDDDDDDYGGLNERQRAALAYTDAMTIGVKVREGVFGELRRRFGERDVVEITAAVAAYNCVSRFLVALDVGEMGGKGEKKEKD